jgi:hypothetical protein
MAARTGRDSRTAFPPFAALTCHVTAGTAAGNVIVKNQFVNKECGRPKQAYSIDFKDAIYLRKFLLLPVPYFLLVNILLKSSVVGTCHNH